MDLSDEMFLLMQEEIQLTNVYSLFDEEDHDREPASSSELEVQSDNNISVWFLYYSSSLFSFYRWFFSRSIFLDEKDNDTRDEIHSLETISSYFLE